MMLLIGCFLLATNLFCFGQNESSGYTMVNKFSVEGDSWWDYLVMDENTDRLFISHGNITQVINSKTGELLNTIQDTKGVHGIALDQNDNKAFISCGRDSSVTVINLTNLEFITNVKVTGANPDAILYDKFSNKVFVYNGRSANATVIDAKSNAVVATIPLAGKPEFSVSDENGKVYVNIEDKSLITVINSKTLKVENTWTLNPGEEPSGLALDNTTHRLFSVCGNKKMIVMDAQNGEIISVLDIGEGTDGCAFDPQLKRAYSSNGEGTVTVVQEENANSFVVLENIPTRRSARTICVNTKTHHMYLSSADYVIAKGSQHARRTVKPRSFAVLDIAPDLP